jgi:hypothetical protein
VDKIDTNTIETNVSKTILEDVKPEDVPSLQNMLTNNKEVTDSLNKSRETKTQYDAVQDEYDNLEQTVRDELKGS